MRAVKFRTPGGLDHLSVVEIDDPGQPSANEVRVRMHASSLNFHDYAVATGVLPTADGRILMADGAGVVESVGTGVAEFVPGDRVISCFFPDWQEGNAPLPTFARTPGDGIDGNAVETIVRPANWFTHMPRAWSLTEGATLPTAGLTAWRALVVEGELRAGQSVLILGTGGVSVIGLLLAKQLGAKVIVTSSSDEKLEHAHKLGADFGVNYRRDTDWAARVRELTDGCGVDLVLEMGGPGTLPQSIQATRIGGRIVLIGVVTGISGAVPTAAIMGRQLRIQGITVGSRSQQIGMVEALDKMSIRPVIHATYPLEKIAEAFRLEQSGLHFGKICIEF